MVYLEVTTSCKSGRNTGIQRVTRALFLRLSARIPVTPVLWNGIGRRFQLLSAKELKTLENPFHAGSHGRAHPELRGENPLADGYRLFANETFDLAKEMQTEDVFLMPDIFRDARTTILPETIRKARGSAVAIFHDAAALRLPGLEKRIASQVAFRRYIESLACFDLVICVSQQSRQDLQELWTEYGEQAAPTAVEPWPVEFDESAGTICARPEGNLIVCICSLEPRKNHLTVLSAAAALWRQGLSFELTIVGRATAGYGWKVAKAISQLRRSGRPIRWLRHVDDATLHRAYRDCKFTVYASLMEGFGLPILESLWHGKPCICGGNGALGETARGGGCMVIDQASESAVAAAMAELLTDNEKYAKLSDEARARTFRDSPDYTDHLQRHLQSLPGRIFPAKS